MNISRKNNLRRLYRHFDLLAAKLGGMRRLDEISRHKDWPLRGIYFFFDPDEPRLGSGIGPRLIRIGTHALNAGSRSTLRQRLRQHAGLSKTPGGNHRGSIFRLLAGDAKIAIGDFVDPPRSWGVEGDLTAAATTLNTARNILKAKEQPVEEAVSAYLRRLPFLWLPVLDEPGSESLRGYIERNAIALASDVAKTPIDPPSPVWLGSHSSREKVRLSGLWNQRHVDEVYEPGFLDVMEDLVQAL